MSDSYLGLDQQYDIHLNVIPASVSAQVNNEISEGVAKIALQWPYADVDGLKRNLVLV